MFPRIFVEKLPRFALQTLVGTVHVTNRLAPISESSHLTSVEPRISELVVLS